MSGEPAITTLFGPLKSARVTPEPPAGNAGRNFARFLGRSLMLFSMFFFLMSGYLAFAHYWVQTEWTKSEATVLSGEFRQSSSGSTSRPGSVGTSSNIYFFHCTVSYLVDGETRQSELDSPRSTYRMDAQVWEASWSRGQHVAILYKPSNPSKIRLVDDPSELTATWPLRVAIYFLVPGTLLILTSRSNGLIPDKRNFRY